MILTLEFFNVTLFLSNGFIFDKKMQDENFVN